MQQRSEETHNRLLHAAQLLFSKKGYDATSVADICGEAGVSKGAFYHHFDSKQALFLNLLEVWLVQIDQNFASLRKTSPDVPSAMLSMARMVGNLFQAADVRQALFLEFWIQAQRDPVVWKTAIAPYQRYEMYFTEMIRAGIAEDSLRPVDPQAAARLTVSLALGLLMQGLFNSSGVDWEQETVKFVEILLDGLARR